MYRILRTVVVVATVVMAGSAAAEAYQPGDGRSLSEEQLKIFEMRASEPLSEEALARERRYQRDAIRHSGAIDG